MNLWLTRTKLFHARLQQECRCLAEWTSLGAIGCIGIGGCVAFALAAVAAILQGHSRPSSTFLAGGIAYVLEATLLMNLFLAERCNERVSLLRQQRDRLLARRNNKDAYPEEDSWSLVIKDILTALQERLTDAFAILLVLVGVLCAAVFVIVIFVAILSAPREQQVQFMKDVYNAKRFQEPSKPPLRQPFPTPSKPPLRQPFPTRGRR
jgi:hypothetical protein